MASRCTCVLEMVFETGQIWVVKRGKKGVGKKTGQAAKQLPIFLLLPFFTHAPFCLLIATWSR